MLRYGGTHLKPCCGMLLHAKHSQTTAKLLRYLLEVSGFLNHMKDYWMENIFTVILCSSQIGDLSILFHFLRNLKMCEGNIIISFLTHM